MATHPVGMAVASRRGREPAGAAPAQPWVVGFAGGALSQPLSKPRAREPHACELQAEAKACPIRVAAGHPKQALFVMKGRQLKFHFSCLPVPLPNLPAAGD